jgi:uncharacterized membrane protein
MALLGRLHPLLIHFPIALVLAAVAAESAAMFTGHVRWRTLAVGKVRAGALFAVLAAIAGWRFALTPDMELSRLLQWHRWLGSIGAVVTVAAALATAGGDGRSSWRWIYRSALFTAGALVGVTGHLGGMLVWGADFLRP